MTPKARRQQKNTRQAVARRSAHRPAPRRCAAPPAPASLITGEEFKALMAVAAGQDPAQTWAH